MKQTLRCLLLLSLAAWFCGCTTTETTVAAGGVAAATVVGSQVPKQQLRQIYYLGVFDPYDQSPPAIYRIRVHGQSSMLSQMRFASGWVPSSMVDSLGTKFAFNDRQEGGLGALSATQTSNLPDSQISAHRKLMLFGPEGFLEAPDDHRLVIVMGQSPDAWFSAIDQALGHVAEVGLQEETSAAIVAVMSELNELDRAKQALKTHEDPLKTTIE